MNIKNWIFTLGLLFLLSGCLKIEDKKKPANSQNETSPVANNTVIKTIKKDLINEPLRMCIRPAHYLGLKKCVRNGKWIKFSLNAKDVDNDRTDVFTEPGMSILKNNFYPETFRIEQGINQITNYPDQYRTNAPYAGEAHFVFAVPTQIDPELHFSYWGRDEGTNDKVLLSQIPNFGIRYVKIQHWNDGRAYKKHASMQFSIIGDYQETNYRYQCSWMEAELGYDFNQTKTKEGILNPKVPETIVWRKITEKCESIPSRFTEPNLVLLPFNEVTPNQLFTNHSFKNETKQQKRIYLQNKELFELDTVTFDLANPFKKFKIKTDGSTPVFKNYRGEEIVKLEGIYDEDLKDKSFNPQKEKDQP